MTLLNTRVPAMCNQGLIGMGIFVLGLWLAYEIGGKSAGGDLTTVAYIAFVFAGLVMAVTILRNWRSRFYLFLTWLLFEDLVRKYMGNNMALFFGKNVLVLLTYISLFAVI